MPRQANVNTKPSINTFHIKNPVYCMHGTLGVHMLLAQSKGGSYDTKWVSNWAQHLIPLEIPVLVWSLKYVKQRWARFTFILHQWVKFGNSRTDLYFLNTMLASSELKQGFYGEIIVYMITTMILGLSIPKGRSGLSTWKYQFSYDHWSTLSNVELG